MYVVDPCEAGRQSSHQDTTVDNMVSSSKDAGPIWLILSNPSSDLCATAHQCSHKSLLGKGAKEMQNEYLFGAKTKMHLRV